MGIIPGRVTYIIDKKGVVRHVFNSQYQPQGMLKKLNRCLRNSIKKKKLSNQQPSTLEAFKEVKDVLKLHNNLTQKTEPFQPAHDKQVKMYTCGPSTYQRPHVGNYRTFLFEDILQRYLEYLGYKVTRLITLTNIEDKAIAYAKTANLSVEELTNRNEDLFFQDFEKLRIKRPDYSMRASTIVDQAVNLIKALMEKGVAYEYTHKAQQTFTLTPQVLWIRKTCPSGHEKVA